MVFLHRATVRGVESGAWLHPLICIHILYPMSSTRNKNTLGNKYDSNNTKAVFIQSLESDEDSFWLEPFVEVTGQSGTSSFRMWPRRTRQSGSPDGVGDSQ